MSGIDAGKRALFETTAAELYERIVTEGGLPVGDVDSLEDKDRGAFDLLADIGLLMQEDGRWLPVDPATVQSQIVAPLGQQGAELIAESASWAKAFAGLAQSWRRSPAAIRGPFTELHGGDQITSFIAALVADAQEELLTAQPQAGRSGRGLAAAAQRDIDALDRGVKLRTLYQHSARRSTATAEYVASVARHGAEVRTLDEFFNRLIVIDRRVAVIPGHEGIGVAVVVREPSMVAYLVDVFERSWERGRSFTDVKTSMVRDIAVEQRAMTIRMLVEGHPDQASAKRLGVSPRTYAAYIADLKREFAAETRFQLGYTMGRLGESGHEDEQPG